MVMPLDHMGEGLEHEAPLTPTLSPQKRREGADRNRGAIVHQAATNVRYRLACALSACKSASLRNVMTATFRARK